MRGSFFGAAYREALRSCGLIRKGVGGVFRHWKVGRRAASLKAVMAGASSGGVFW